jgi:release factor glutamine methyltransferase
VVELCAGSGAISLAIAQESRPAHHWAVELSENAFGYLVENLRSTTVVPVHDDMATALRQLNGTIDLVVANPPYIPEIDRESLPVDVSHDPSTALFSGVDGLDHLRTVAQVAKRLLKPGSVVGSEHGDDQAEQVRRIFESTGFVNIKTHLDLTSRPRFVTATKPDME